MGNGNLEIEVILSNKIMKTKQKIDTIIEFSSEFMKENDIYQNEWVDLKTKDGIKILKAINNEKLEANEISVSKNNKNTLYDEVFIVKKDKFLFRGIRIQKSEDIAKQIITIDKTLQEEIQRLKVKKFEIVNEITGNSMDIEKDKIVYEDFKNTSVIRLNYFQRSVLETELPKSLSKYNLERLLENLEEDKDIDTLKKYYEKGKALDSRVLEAVEDKFKFKQDLKKIFERARWNNIVIYPIEENIKKISIRSKIGKKFLEKLVGVNKINLKTIRPYETDEISNVVRLTKSTLELLGIDETDNVEITYRGEKITARALIIDSIESMKDTNIIQAESELNICIGIPAHIRAKLKIKDIGTCCVVERDMKYLFRKNLNLQLISLIATVLTVKQTFGNYKLVIGLLIILLPLISFVIFAGVRDRIKS